MQRVPSALLSPSPSAPKNLLPKDAVPHSESCTALPLEWCWNHTAGPRRGVAPTTFTPCGYEPAYAYPLLVWLHGANDGPAALPDLMRHVSVRNFVAVAPDGGAVESGGGPWRQSSEAIADAENAVFDAIESAMERFRLNEQRVFIAGVGVGGSMAIRIALRNPERFGSAATLDGPLPRWGRLLASVNRVRRLPLLISAGRGSKSYSERRVCDDLRLLHSAGCRVAVRQYPGSDELTTAMLGDLNRWLMQLVCGESQSG